MAWIEVHDTLPDHPKVLRAARALKLDSDALVGKLIRLWVWALANREDGVLSDLDAAQLGRLLNCNGRAERLLTALTENRLLDPLPGGQYSIHGWDEHVMMLRERREETRRKSADRVRRYRERRKRAEETEGNALQARYEGAACNGYAQEDCNAGNARTVPNRTLLDDDDDDTTPIPPRAREEAREGVARGFAETVGREPTPEELDCLAAQTGATGGMSPEMIGLALRKALLYGAASVTAYACKVLGNWRKNCLFTPEAVQEWEAGRDGV